MLVPVAVQNPPFAPPALYATLMFPNDFEA